MIWSDALAVRVSGVGFWEADPIRGVPTTAKS
jgi:hypothetical protein